MGLAKAMGMNLKKDAFSEQNLKTRDHILMIKEKLAYAFYKKLNDQNHWINYQDDTKDKDGHSSEDNIETGNSYDSTVASKGENNTPKSKLGMKKSKDESDIEEKKTQTKDEPPTFQFPHPNVIYKYFIGKGNNSIMVRTLFKNRFWWVQCDSESYLQSSNFYWTQVKTQKILDNIPCKFPGRKAGNKNVNMSLMGGYNKTPLHGNSNKKKG